ncbi:hypothetical protein CEXT_283701 [Caerostris extrusa]|uniref:Uncharacterized protein n=1 Tax=Caerostris extrusa TaxID=172846 RepID=A0AAV4R3F4_CAEEX|nr:hypothetical protein CEXT_283701 [Caerostris extrusa]
MKLSLAISVDVCNLVFGWKLEFMNGEGENGKSKLAILDENPSFWPSSILGSSTVGKTNCSIVTYLTSGFGFG